MSPRKNARAKRALRLDVHPYARPSPDWRTSGIDNGACTMRARLLAVIGAAPSSRVAIGTANAFVIACAILCYVTDAPPAPFAGWTLRGSLASGSARATGSSAIASPRETGLMPRPATAFRWRWRARPWPGR